MNEPSDEILSIEEFATNGQIPAFKLGVPALDKLERLIVEIDALKSKLILLIGNGGKTQFLCVLAQRLNAAPINVDVKLGGPLRFLYDMALTRSEEQ